MSSDPSAPDWLQKTGNDTDLEYGSSSRAGSAEMTDNNNGSTTGGKKNSASTSPPVSKCGRCCQWTMNICSAMLMAIFIASATFQSNDAGNSVIVWWIFYALHATLAAFCLFLRCVAGYACIEKPVQLLMAILFIYSIVLISIASVQLSTAVRSDPGGDAAQFNDREEKALEVSGATLGLFSTIFHMCMWKCCGGRGGGRSKNDNEEDE